jgi:hypothetical protein
VRRPPLDVFDADGIEHPARPQELGGVPEVQLRLRQPGFGNRTGRGLLLEVLEVKGGVLRERGLALDLEEVLRATTALQLLDQLGRELPGYVGVGCGELLAVGDEGLAVRLARPEDVGVVTDVDVVAEPAAPLRV